MTGWAFLVLMLTVSFTMLAIICSGTSQLAKAIGVIVTMTLAWGAGFLGAPLWLLTFGLGCSLMAFVISFGRAIE